MNRGIGRQALRFLIITTGLTLFTCTNGVSQASAAVGNSKNESDSAASSLNGEIRRRAEIERRIGYQSGGGLAESSLLERAGEYGEAVFSAYKDLAYARSHGAVAQELIEERLQELLSNSQTGSLELDGARNQAIARSVQAIRAFNFGSWEECVSLIQKNDISDSFSNWMLLVSNIQIRPGDQALLSRYAGIQSRYRLFPEYWYFSMLREKEMDLARDAAQRCITLAPGGPRALEARRVIALSYELDSKDSSSLLVVPEIEGIAANAMNQGSPELLKALFPVLALPDNPSTLYALGVLKGLCENAAVQTWVQAESKKAGKRLSERLRYAGGTL